MNLQLTPRKHAGLAWTACFGGESRHDFGPCSGSAKAWHSTPLPLPSGLLRFVCQDGTCHVHILLYLLHQVVGIRERSGVANLGDEINRQRLPVKVPLESDEMRFDLAFLLAESRIGPDVGGAG